MDSPSFESVYEEHFDFIWSSSRHLGVRASAMDDVVLEVFELVRSGLQGLPRRYMRSWLYCVVRYVVRNRRPREVSGVVVKSDFAKTEEARAAGDCDVARLADVLGEIDALKREVFVLGELLEMSVVEIADALAMPPDIIHSQLRTARLVLDAKLARRVDDAEAMLV